MRSRFLPAALAAALAGCSGLGTVPQANGSNAPAARVDTFSLTPFNAPSSVFPGAASTEPTGIRPDWITAQVKLQSGDTAGGLYDRKKQTWVQLNYPGAQSTSIYGPESVGAKDYRVVGSYQMPGQSGFSGFFYNSRSKKFKTLVADNCSSNSQNPVPCTFTIAHSIFGSPDYQIVGNYDATAKSDELAGHAFIYSSVTKKMSTIDIKGAISTTAYGIWMNGKRIVVAGGYTDKTGRHAYLRELRPRGHMVTFDYPGAALTHFEGITGGGGSGNYHLVGDFTKPRDKAVYGFYLEIHDWKPWPPILIGKVSANSVSDRDAIGIYNQNGAVSGFITTMPVQDPP